MARRLAVAGALAAGVLVATPAAAQQLPATQVAIPAAAPDDVKSIDAIVGAVYDVISGDKGVKRDWNRFRSLFHPGARMIPTGTNPQSGKAGARVITPEDYIRRSGPFLEGQGFHEVEIGRRVDQFGNIAHVFSTYQARHALSDPAPFMRGVNSIQLLNDGERWWVLSIAWSQETPQHPIPEQYLRKQ